MPKIVSFDVNLVPRDPFFQTIIGKTLQWSLSVGRYIVIFTELIVILSFVSRFTLDRRVTDLNNSIHQKQVIIESFGNLEDNVRRAQKIIEEYQQVSQQTDIVEVFPSLTEITPPAIVLEQLSITSEQVVVSGTTFSQNALNTLIANIQLSQDFHDVEITRIESEDKENVPSFNFSLRAKTSQGVTDSDE